MKDPKIIGIGGVFFKAKSAATISVGSFKLFDASSISKGLKNET